METLAKEGTCLLTLSRHDLSSNSISESSNNNDSDTLMLMQLPPSLSASDMKGAYMVAASPSEQACLVVEKKACAFAMSRVETSNAYILVPPSRPSSSLNDEQNTEKPPAHKKPKTMTADIMVSTPARLLQRGGSGASFIELKKKALSLADLHKKFQVFDPFDADQTWNGPTCSSLAVDLQASQQEVRDGLHRLQALGIMGSDGGTMTYGLLSEEALQEAKVSIVATLTECDDFQDYAGTGIWEDECVEQVMKRSGETYKHMRDIIAHTLQTLQSDDAQAADGDKIQLSVQKVAVCVVHRLFSKQSDPWEEQELIAQWQREMPGVGNNYCVSLDMLSGVALRCTTTTTQTKWKYFPEEKLPADLSKRFEVLFEEKEKWTMDELKPYVQRLATEEQSEADLLLKHTCFVTEQVDGVSTKFFMKR